MKINTLIKWTGFIAIGVLPVGFTIACSPFQSTTPLKNKRQEEETKTYLMTSAHDGDTFTLNTIGNIRLYGVDSAEISNNINGKWINTTGLEHKWAIKARDYVISHFLYQNIKASFMEGNTYRRKIAKLYFGDTDIAISLLKKGLVRVGYISTTKENKYFTNDVDYYNKLKTTEAEAKKNRVGLWNENVSQIYHSKPIITN